jgi:hypothetical protein
MWKSNRNRHRKKEEEKGDMKVETARQQRPDVLSLLLLHFNKTVLLQKATLVSKI